MEPKGEVALDWPQTGVRVTHPAVKGVGEEAGHESSLHAHLLVFTEQLLCASRTWNIRGVFIKGL